ncbi:hypothetical protein WBP06_02990 [Novosphingobium sp. BL-8H]
MLILQGSLDRIDDIDRKTLPRSQHRNNLAHRPGVAAQSITLIG